MFPQNRKKMLFLKAGECLQFILEFREQLFPGLDRAIRRVASLLKSSLALDGSCWSKSSDCYFAILMGALSGCRSGSGVQNLLLPDLPPISSTVTS